MEEIVIEGYQKIRKIWSDDKKTCQLELIEDNTPRQKTFKEKVEDVLREKGLIV